MLFAVSLLATSTSSLARHENSRIVPPERHYKGLTYGEWQMKFNQWFYGVPAADNASLIGNEDKLAVGQPKHVWFLANVVPVADRHIIIPKGKALWVTIFGVEWDNYLCVEPDMSLTVNELRALVKGIVDSMTDIEVTIDGVLVHNVMAYRSITPEFALTLPDANILQLLGCGDALPGTYKPAVADARALLVKPLPVGEHTINISAVVVVDPSKPSHNVDVDITWRITVVPQNDQDGDGDDD
jgi:hypothetical protein